MKKITVNGKEIEVEKYSGPLSDAELEGVQGGDCLNIDPYSDSPIGQYRCSCKKWRSNWYVNLFYDDMASNEIDVHLNSVDPSEMANHIISFVNR